MVRIISYDSNILEGFFEMAVLIDYFMLFACSHFSRIQIQLNRLLYHYLKAVIA